MRRMREGKGEPMLTSYRKASETAERWGISLHRVQELCKMGRIEGACKFGKSWMIPVDAQKPSDARCRAAKTHAEPPVGATVGATVGASVGAPPSLPMPRKSPFLNMTNLYTAPGTADRVIASLSENPEAQALCAAEFAYCRGEIDKVTVHAREFLLSHSGFYAVNAGGMLLALAAMWKGDIRLYREAKVHICEAPAKTDGDRDIMALSLACINTAVRDIANYPEWFRYGQFERLHPDSHPAAKVFYVRFFIIAAQEQAKGVIKFPDVTGMGLMRVIPYITEPLISRVVAERLVIPELYLRMLVAVAYHQLGEDARAIPHLDKAIDLALPDRLLGLLAEHRRNLDSLLDDRLRLKDEAALEELKRLHSGLIEGWTRLHNSLLSGNVSRALTIREREIGRLAAFGLSNEQIAEQLYITVDAVKKSIFRIMNKTGVGKREEIGAYV